MVVGIGWNAGAVRARLLANRRLGRDEVQRLARSASYDDALRALSQGPYGQDVEVEMRLPEAQWAVAATPLWHLRVLAGWLPPAGGELVRVLAGWWEVLNVENLLAGLTGGEELPAYDLGRLDTAWDELRHAGSPDQVRTALASSPWMDPGASDLATVVTWLRLAWARRVAEEVDSASRLAAGWAALVAARDLLLGAGTCQALGTHRISVLGSDWEGAHDLPGLIERLPSDASWVLDDLTEPSELWRGEARWWRQLDEDGQDRLGRSNSGPDAVVGIFAVLLADAHRVQGALELAARAELDEELVHAAL